MRVLSVSWRGGNNIKGKINPISVTPPIAIIVFTTEPLVGGIPTSIKSAGVLLFDLFKYNLALAARPTSADTVATNSPICSESY